MSEQKGLKLIVEDISRDVEFLVEEKTLNSPQNFYLRAPMLLVGERNKNGRVYDPMELSLEVDRYTREMIKEDRALGELNHPASAEVNLERACHKIVSLVQEGKHFIGKSKVLNTPMGILTRTLIQDGVKIGVSSRCLGKLVSENFNTNKVVGARLVAVDVVADPSSPKSFCEGILEARQFLITSNGLIEEMYDQFETALANIPRKDAEKYLLEQVTSFINKLKNS